MSKGQTGRNIEGAPIIGRIKALEATLLGSHKDPDKEYTKEERKALTSLLEEFGKLLNVKYGALGYLVESNSEDIIRLYGVDTDQDFYSMTSKRMRVPDKQMDSMVEAGGGKVFLGELGVTAQDPVETEANEKVSNDDVKRIVVAIKERLSGDY